MKTVHCPTPGFRCQVPVGNYSLTLEFTGHRCAVPNWAIELALKFNPQFTVVGDWDVKPPESVLIYRPGGLGDIALCTPLVRALSKRGTKVDFECDIRNVPILENNPYIHRAWACGPPGISAPRAAGSYDAILNLEWFVEQLDNIGNRMHRAAAFAHYCDIALDPCKRSEIGIDVVVTEEERAWALSILTNANNKCAPGNGRWVAYVANTFSNPTREWKTDTHRMVLNVVLDAGFNIVILGNQPIENTWQDNPRASAVCDLTCQTKVREMIALVGAVNAVICPDTGTFHIAQALGTHVLSPFGPFPLKERQTHPAVTQIGSPLDCVLAPCRSYNCHVSNGGESPCLATTHERIISALERTTS